jgi:uncharacterized protein YPO0396
MTQRKWSAECQQEVIDETYRRNVEHCEEIKRLTAENQRLDAGWKAANDRILGILVERDDLLNRMTTAEFERDALRADADRLEYLCGDWVGETAAKRNRLLSRMSAMSAGAVRAQIDADLAAIAGEMK